MAVASFSEKSGTNMGTLHIFQFLIQVVVQLLSLLIQKKCVFTSRAVGWHKTIFNILTFILSLLIHQE